MNVGVALPSMAAGFTGSGLRQWCQQVDAGPFSSISTGERVTFVNPELITTLSAAAALTTRVDVMANIVVAPLHAPAMLAQQLATIDVLSEGRLVVGLGVGGRAHDYESVGASFAHRHQRVDDMASTLRRLWAGEPPFAGADPVGPRPWRSTGPRLVAGALGPRALARAAQWADGITGFSILATRDEFDGGVDAARAAWKDAGRSEQPWIGTGTFCVLGIPRARETLEAFATTYLSFLGPELASALASRLVVHDEAALARVLDDAAAAGIDELTVVPGTWDLACLGAIEEVVASCGSPASEATPLRPT